MTRASYALTLLLVAFGGSLMVTNPARCQLGFDYNYYGTCYREACPFADGNVQTDQEVTGSAHTDRLPGAADLRGRMVVAILDDPVTISASHPDATADDAVVDAAADGAEEAGAAYSKAANMRTESQSRSVQSVNGSDAMTDVYNYRSRYEYLLQHGYIHYDDPAYGAMCDRADATDAREVVDTPPDVVRDCENEVYQAYLQRCAEEAVANALTIAPAAERGASESAASDASYEPYEPYEPYDYAPYDPWKTESVSSPSGHPSGYAPGYEHGYGYGYEYDYGYHWERSASSQSEPAVGTEDADTSPDLDIQRMMDLGRDLFSSLLESDLAEAVEAAAERVTHYVARTADAMGVDQIGRDVTEALAAAFQRPLPNPNDADCDWAHAHVYAFTFDVSAAEETLTAQSPVDREMARQWTCRVINSVAAALDRVAVALRRFADQSVATAPGSDQWSTTQR